MTQEQPAAEGDGALPAYARLMEAYHRAYAAELSELVGTLLLRPGDSALDVACGDAVYARLLSDRVGSSGTVAAVDVSRQWLRLARSKCLGDEPAPIQFYQASAESLPFASDSFDLVWCAQSFYSLPNSRLAVREMVRVARPGGVVGVLENDALHHLLLPWPVEIELAVRTAELQAFAEETTHAGKYYVGRRLSAEFLREGLEHIGERTWATTRQQPWSEADRTFVCEYLANLRDRVAGVLSREALERLDAWLGANARQTLLERPDFTTVCLDRLCWGIKPGVARR